MERKIIINIVLLVAFLTVGYFAFFNKTTMHGEPQKWLKDHSFIVKRSQQPERCLSCHAPQQYQKDYKKHYQEPNKRKEMLKFCNDCHAQQQVKPIE